jgi:SAM-dependent methyltransferase
LLSRLNSRYERFGIEVNRDAARLAQDTTGARVWQSIEEVPAHLQFDIVVIADVVEHLPDPRYLFELIEGKLAQGGVVIVSTGDADNRLWNFFGANWWYCFYPEHIAFVSRAWIDRALCPRGWFVLHCQRFRYRRCSQARRILELALVCAYGFWPRGYLYIGNVLKRWAGRSVVTSVAGNGVSADHLLFAVARNRPP